MSFKGKVVIVTGASSGIGAATAFLFTQEGAKVAIVARNEAKLKNVAEQCSKAGGKPLVIKADVSKDDDAKRIINDTVAKFGKLDVLVNNAGIVRFGNILDGTAIQIYDELMSINYRSVVMLTTLAAPHLIKTKGNIVNVSSISGILVNDVRLGIYCSTKAALNHFSRASALELAAHGVRVNFVCPGPVKTDILENASIDSMTYDDMASVTALKRISDGEEIGHVILFLASDKAKGVTGSGYTSDNGHLINAEIPSK